MVTNDIDDLANIKVELDKLKLVQLLKLRKYIEELMQDKVSESKNITKAKWNFLDTFGKYPSNTLEITRVKKKPTPPIAGYVYLVRNSFGHYKIGMSTNPKKRIKNLGVDLPFEIVTEHLIKCTNYREAEYQLHKKYAAKRVNGEWYALSEQDVADIKAIQEM